MERINRIRAKIFRSDKISLEIIKEGKKCMCIKNAFENTIEYVHTIKMHRVGYVESKITKCWKNLL